MNLKLLTKIILISVAFFSISQSVTAQNVYCISDIVYDPVSKKATSISITTMDYSVGLYYDPIVIGNLHKDETKIKIDSDTGFAHINSAIVVMQNSDYSLPDVRYDIFSDHYIVPYFRWTMDQLDENKKLQQKILWYDPLSLSNYGGGQDSAFYEFKGSKNFETYYEHQYFNLGTTGKGVNSPK